MDINDYKAKIQEIVNIWETGSATGDYSNISIYNDGPRNLKQITYGRSQLTEYGNLKALIRRYIDKKGIHATFFSTYLYKIGMIPLSSDKIFVNKLKMAGEDPIMRQAQDEIFDEEYWQPAFMWFKENGFTLPLSMLVIYDSYIHSGTILNFLRNSFKENVPLKGGDEKKWIREYLKVRNNWLANHKTRPILRKTTYRTKDMLREANLENWMLEKDLTANGVFVSMKIAVKSFFSFFKK